MTRSAWWGLALPVSCCSPVRCGPASTWRCRSPGVAWFSPASGHETIRPTGSGSRWRAAGRARLPGREGVCGTWALGCLRRGWVGGGRGFLQCEGAAVAVVNGLSSSTIYVAEHRENTGPCTARARVCRERRAGRLSVLLPGWVRAAWSTLFYEDVNAVRAANVTLLQLVVTDRAAARPIDFRTTSRDS